MTKLNNAMYGGDTHFQQMISRMKPYSIHASPDPIARVIKFRKVYQEFIGTLGLTAQQRDQLSTKIEDFATASYDAGVRE
tara:strand:+ start:164 stop:403 length:240 start_codon:yes stop_codon:yes gene_type:complete